MSISTTKSNYITLTYIEKISICIRKFYDELNITKAITAYTLCKNNKTNIILIRNVESQA